MPSSVKRGECEGSHLVLHSSWGAIRVEAKGGEIVSCALARLDSRPRRPFLWRSTERQARDRRDREALARAERYIRSLFRGRPRNAPSIKIPPGTVFQQRVWKNLLSIPTGRTLSYGELAARAGRPKAARAIGSACGANVLPLFIPCHRVVAADGRTGGYSSGAAWKEFLLERERYGNTSRSAALSRLA